MNFETIVNLTSVYVGFVIFFQFVVFCLGVTFFVFFINKWRKIK